jgi:hypothetical protein
MEALWILNNQWVKEEIIREIRKYVEIKKKTTIVKCKTKVMLRGKSVAILAYIES